MKALLHFNFIFSTKLMILLYMQNWGAS